jgi:hypothetical protein
MEEPIVNTVPGSILETTKKLLGLTKEYDSFDTDIIIHINTVFSNLTQMGIGPEEGFTITGYSETWDQFITSNELKTQQVKSYMALKVKSLFDPSANGNVSEAIKNAISEMEYRLYVEEENSRHNTELVLEEEVVVDE